MTFASESPAPSSPVLEVVPLGGVGEFGMNMMAVSCEGTTIVIDAGVMFPEAELPGVELVIPDLTYLETHRPAALVLTHGHEDHIGATPYVWPLVDGPVYGTSFTLALVRPKLEEHGLDPGDRLVAVKPRETVQIGPFRVEFLRVTHSMPDCVALALHTPLGTVVHTGDFKIDQTPLDDEHTDVHRLAEIGSAGALALFGDSTNVDRKGFTGSEREVIDAFEEIYTSTRGKLVVTMFASSVPRMQILVDLAVQFERQVAFVGRGVLQTSQTAMALGRLQMPPGVQIRDSEVRALRPERVVCITTGSQGEPLSALSRIAVGDHRHVALEDGDTVVFSARAIPGNEKAIGRVMNHVARRGAELIYEGIKHVHVSGHGSEEELKLMLSLVRPRFFVPIHGEYRQLARHAQIARQVTGGRTEILMASNGACVRFDAAGARLDGSAPAGRVLIDGTRTGEVADEVLRDRRHLAGDGLVVPVVAINAQEGTLADAPEMITRGFVVDERTEALLREAAGLVPAVVETASIEERADYGVMREKVRVELQRFFRKRAGTRPLVLPIIMET